MACILMSINEIVGEEITLTSILSLQKGEEVKGYYPYDVLLQSACSYSTTDMGKAFIQSEEWLLPLQCGDIVVMTRVGVKV